MSELEEQVEKLRKVGRYLRGRGGIDLETAIQLLADVAAFMHDQEAERDLLDVKRHEAMNEAEDMKVWQRRFARLMEGVEDLNRGILGVPELLPLAREIEGVVLA